MDLTLESKACSACAKAKRRCGKQIPACSRCESRRMSCEYPASKTFCLPPRRQHFGEPQASQWQTDTIIDVSGDVDEPPIPDQLFDIDAIAVDDLFAVQFGPDTTAFPPAGTPCYRNVSPKSPALLPSRYLESSSWAIDQSAPLDLHISFCSTVLNCHIEKIQAWQARWVNTGVNPYIHPNVYNFRRPRCVQDAFTTLSTYMNRTPQNKFMIEMLVEERVRQLLKDQPVGLSDDSKDGHGSLSTLEHMARVHALHIYQTIGLFDGSIRLRHVAETQIPTLNTWLRQLLSSAQAEAAGGPEVFVGSLLMDPDSTGEQSQPQQARPDDGGGNFVNAPCVNMTTLALSGAHTVLGAEDTAWYAWALAETIRRTWMVATTTQTIFLTLQLRWAPCPGGSVFTVPKDLWTAESAFAWAERAERYEGEEDGLDFVKRNAWERVLERWRPDEVDEFVLGALEMSCGLERMERWRASAATRSRAKG